MLRLLAGMLAKFVSGTSTQFKIGTANLADVLPERYSRPVITKQFALV